MEFKQVLSWVNDLLSYHLFVLNQTPVTIYSLMVFVVLILVFYALSRSLNRYALDRLFKGLNLEKGTRYTLKRITQYLIMTLGILFSLQFVGINLSSLTMLFGLLSVGIGFGLQNIASNFISGLILLFERPISIGDHVTVGQTEGVVSRISIRSTTINSLNNISIIVPNSEFISSNVINWSIGDPKIRMDVPVGVSYNSDLETVLASLKQVARENPDVLKKPAPDVLLESFGDSSWNMVLRVWIANPERHHKIRSDINCQIIRVFRAKGIDIPFPQRDIHIIGPSGEKSEKAAPRVL